jgi:cytochrome c biogenesis protein CcmG, thiol:disulfide interchange protein DsbE
VPLFKHTKGVLAPSANLWKVLRGLVTAVCLLALAGCGSDDEPKSASPPGKEKLAGAPKPLAGVHDQANRLLDGGPGAFRARLRELRGYPVVVNKWASWCPPCRAEFPFFQRQAIARAKTTAFIGVDSNDSDGDARRFLREFPVPYPSYKDPNLAVAAVFKGVQAFPVTAFYDRKGKLAFVHQGGYASERKLAEDIERYAR